MKAIDITTASVGHYKTLRLKENVAPATVNRELAARTTDQARRRGRYLIRLAREGEALLFGESVAPIVVVLRGQ